MERSLINTEERDATDDETAEIEARYAGRDCCANCKFYDFLGVTTTVYEFSDGTNVKGTTESGTCHRYPPVVIPCGNDEEPDDRQPYVSGFDWCGEFKPKE